MLLLPFPCSMVPHKTKRGDAALERLKVYEGVPAPYDRVKRLVVPEALQVLRLQHGHRFCKLGELAATVSNSSSSTACSRGAPGRFGRTGLGPIPWTRACTGGPWYSGKDRKVSKFNFPYNLLEFEHYAGSGCVLTSSGFTIALLQVGWRHSETIKELENKRKAKSLKFYEAKKRLHALRAKAVAQVEAGKA